MTREELIERGIDEGEISWVSYDDIEQRYHEDLQELYGDVEICGMTYDAADTLKEIDPTAYRCGCVDWTDAQYRGWDEFDYEGETGLLDTGAADDYVDEHEDELDDYEQEKG